MIEEKELLDLLPFDRFKEAGKRADKIVEEFTKLSFSEMTKSMCTLIVRMEYMKEVIDYQKEIIQKRG